MLASQREGERCNEETQSREPAGHSIAVFSLRPVTSFSKSHSLVLSASDVEHQMPLISPPSIRTEAPVIHFAWGDTM